LRRRPSSRSLCRSRPPSSSCCSRSGGTERRVSALRFGPALGVGASLPILRSRTAGGPLARRGDARLQLNHSDTRVVSAPGAPGTTPSNERCASRPVASGSRQAGRLPPGQRRFSARGAGPACCRRAHDATVLEEEAHDDRDEQGLHGGRSRPARDDGHRGWRADAGGRQAGRESLRGDGRANRRAQEPPHRVRERQRPGARRGRRRRRA